MSDRVKLSVVGVGLMGRQHVKAIQQADGSELVSIADPSPQAAAFAGSLGLPHYASLEEMITSEKPDGVILATPNQLHVEQGLECVAAGLPMLVEKPIATDVSSAKDLIAAAESAGVPILVGHHRRHNPIVVKARELIGSGAIGEIVGVQATCWLYKPDTYFDIEWRRQPGAGPVFINLIHDIDLLRHLCGEIVEAAAYSSNVTRGFAVEDTAAVLLRFANGAVGTASVSDTIVGPWSWEMTAQENAAYPNTNEFCYVIGGTHGSIEIPDLRIWRQPERRGWWEPISDESISVNKADPFVLQISHFRDVVRGVAEPLISGRDATNTLKIIEMITTSFLNSR